MHSVPSDSQARDQDGVCARGVGSVLTGVINTDVPKSVEQANKENTSSEGKFHFVELQSFHICSPVEPKIFELALASAPQN